MSRRGVGSTERCVTLTLLLLTGDVWPRQPTPSSTAREIVAMVDAGNLDPLSHRLSEAASHSLPIDQLHARAADVRAKYGPSIDIEPIYERSDGDVFEVVAEQGNWELTLELTGDGAIDHLAIEPAVMRSPPLGLPFRGEWQVSSAGRRRAENRHGTPAQRRAADILAVDASGKTYRGAGDRNEDYFGYGQDIVAMADGVVVVAVDGVHENTPGQREEWFFAGNMVLVEHGEDLYAMYAHLIPGTVAVEAGDEVHRGQLLGSCGNSGRSTAPHLHVHGQDKPLVPGAWGIELMFEHVQRVRYDKRTLIPTYVLRKGDIIAPGSP